MSDNIRKAHISVVLMGRRWVQHPFKMKSLPFQNERVGGGAFAGQKEKQADNWGDSAFAPSCGTSFAYTLMRKTATNEEPWKEIHSASST